MEQNIEDKVSEPIGQDGLGHSTLGRLKSPSNRLLKCIHVPPTITMIFLTPANAKRPKKEVYKKPQPSYENTGL